ncbi:MAG: pyridoxal phosphate-dependent aminotransferase [Planctomycetes bacterium]|nr:pyridoxal phosphate-dependent aminotransferase [Planctomycetota bacterium]NUQ34894.1 pyridoxal phosphate-dependent aminotransferase [Planctomycetaceae bacterium]
MIMTSPIAHRLAASLPSATVRIADIASALRRNGVKILDFSAGRASEATPQYICDAALDAMQRGDTHQTPARGTPDYLAACAQKLARENNLRVDPDTNIIATMGVKQGLFLGLLAVINPGDEVIVEDPCFVSYQPLIQYVGGVPIAVPLRKEHGYRWRQEDLERAITPKTRGILICNPHNPLGTVMTTHDLQCIANVAMKHHLTVFSDETYERVTWGGRKHLSIAALHGMSERTLTLMTFTKSYAMGGWRTGFARGSERLINAMTIAQQHTLTCASSINQAAAARAITETRPEVRAMWKDWERRCEYAVKEINAIPGLSCDMPEGGFYAWIDIRQREQSSEAFCERLLNDHHIALVPGAAFGPRGEGFVRMTCVKSWDELRAGIALLRAIL